MCTNSSYLLLRRLRHLRSISICNVSLIRGDNIQGTKWKLFPCYLILEDTSGEIVYVSEVQTGAHTSLRFNELPLLENAVQTFVSLEVVAQLPSPEFPKNDWVVLCSYSIDFNSLTYVGKTHPLSNVPGINVPIFEFNDGYYALTPIPYEEPTNTPIKLQTKKSITFNSLLKLGRMLEYLSQVKLESRKFAYDLQFLIQELHEEEMDMAIKSTLMDLEYQNERKLAVLGSLKRCVLQISPKPEEEEPFDNDYGSMYSELVQKKHRILNLQERKFKKLIDIFTNTTLFQSPYVILHAADADSPYNISLEKLDLQTILHTDNRISMNTMLGYYLLFISILARKICYIPLPYSLAYYGSTSVINNTLPLYLTLSPTQQQIESFSTAIDLFNMDIMQVKQYLYNRRE
ncbi:HBL008Cp [Eremothecium sinecaudum]|uniref:HBL008Cp n=1 Tax=Eremothecium sinecaudum TaxID=45286 RepID=A0A109UWN4_9SACH|nr:HBL008Cp [Eremothecium sinecaudum]AMD18894.1 HBL008Cp [Eremothecium sinecaudum]